MTNTMIYKATTKVNLGQYAAIAAASMVFTVNIQERTITLDVLYMPTETEEQLMSTHQLISMLKLDVDAEQMIRVA